MSIKRSPRMRDVASLAGVATMTVSRVINGNQHVTDEMRQRVFAAVEALKYRPNTMARALRERRSRQIGIIVPNIHDPFFAICAQSVSMAAKEHDYSVNIAMSAEDPESECNEAILMLQRNVEGLIVIPAAGKKTHLAETDFADMPIVTLDRPLPMGKFDSVLVENLEGTRFAVEHLLGHGHRRIAFIGLPLDLYTMKTRHDGYLLAMKGAEAIPEFYCGRFEQREMVATLKKITARRKPVTSIFCGNNLTTRNVLHGLATLGIKIPKDMALAGFDDFETADLLNPAITVVSQPSVALGRNGAELLFSRISHKAKSIKARQIVLPVEFIIRNSCGCDLPR